MARVSDDQSDKLLTSGQVAQLCGVSNATIHHWRRQGTITCFRTPGNQLRFRAADVAAFLRLWDYPVPSALLASTSPSVLVVGDRHVLVTLRRVLNRSRTIHQVTDFIDVTLRIGTEPTAAIIVQGRKVVGNAGMFRLMARAVLRAKQIPIVVLGEIPPEIICEGVTIVPLGDCKTIRTILQKLMYEKALIAACKPRPRKREKSI